LLGAGVVANVLLVKSKGFDGRLAAESTSVGGWP